MCPRVGGSGHLVYQDGMVLAKLKLQSDGLANNDLV